MFSGYGYCLVSGFFPRFFRNGGDFRRFLLVSTEAASKI